MTKSKFADLISKQREEKKDSSFKGTFLEYLDVLENNPKIAALAGDGPFKSGSVGKAEK